MSALSKATQSPRRRITTVFLSGVIAVAVIGYLVEIREGVPQPDPWPPPDLRDAQAISAAEVVPATSYAQMQAIRLAARDRHPISLAPFHQPPYDLSADIQPDPEARQLSLQRRAATRAFNGAPPVIPHAIEQTSDAACYACHGQGLQLGDRVAQQMSHKFLANCVQCHAPPPPSPFSREVEEVETQFTGMATPLAGDRAYPGAPPTIPHSTWMRESCLACHGTRTGWPGMESTHPWRSACLQCHAPSASLEQALTADVSFLPGPQETTP